MSTWEYTQDTCDVWEIHHLSNHMAEHGWEPVFAVECIESVQLNDKIGDGNGPRRAGRPLRPYTILFRRAVTA